MRIGTLRRISSTTHRGFLSSTGVLLEGVSVSQQLFSIPDEKFALFVETASSKQDAGLPSKGNLSGERSVERQLRSCLLLEGKCIYFNS